MKPEFSFELTSEAAQRNYLILKKYNLDLKAALNVNSSLPLGHGSEFNRTQRYSNPFSSSILSGLD
jgi:hypothetical protein